MAMPAHPLATREVTEPVDLCRPDGRLNPDAVGWSRRPLHRANLRGWGRTKRWEYWCVQTPDLVLALTVSNIDYAGLPAVWFLSPDRQEVKAGGLIPLGRVTMPDRSGGGPVQVESGSLRIRLTPGAEGTRLQARTAELAADVWVHRPAGHESLGVVVPWSQKRFQYTVKENTLPAEGQVIVGEQVHLIEGPDAWATLDHGRGRWPYRVIWNWGSGSGRVSSGGSEHVVGLQLGGRWTDGTGATENALTVDGVLHTIHDELEWSYDTTDWLAPWRIRPRTGARVDLEFRPFHDRADKFELGVLGSDTHQCFGTWYGHVVDDDGKPWDIDGMRGWAEQVRMRW